MATTDTGADRARAEAEGEEKEYDWRGGKLRLPAELPFDVVRKWLGGDPTAGLARLLGDEQFEALMAAERPAFSTKDAEKLFLAIAALYGLGDEGNSPASLTSSSNGSS